MEAVLEIENAIRFEVFTKVPSWFFRDSLSVPFTYHSLLTDIGMVQRTPLQEDIEKTVRHLNDFFPVPSSLIDQLAQQLKGLKCELVMCDIAPMGILAAREAGIPSVLVENFTWDWIYQGYAGVDENINRHISYLEPIYDSVDHLIQTEPVCRYRNAQIITLPVSRRFRTPREKTRKQLRIPVDKKAVLITMGGIPVRYTFIKELKSHPDVAFIVPGASRSMEWTDNLVFLPHHSDFYHPDLVNASDAVIGKLGYSTVAEVYHSGVPFGYVSRANFRESQMLARYAERQMPSLAIEEADFDNGRWLRQLPELLSLKRVCRKGPNGSEQIAAYICALLKAGPRRNGT
jgi:hypothetical protein